MIPIRTLSSVFSPPVVTWALIGVNVAVFLWARTANEGDFARTEFEYSLVPENLLGGPVTVLTYEGQQVAAVVPGTGRMPRPLTDVDPERIRRVDTQVGSEWVLERRRGGYLHLDEETQELNPWLTILTAMFMHAGWLHLISNMWALWVFGPNVEDTLGKLGFLVYYLLCGVGATAAQFAHDPHSVVPNLGASGAILGVMGGLAVRFPRAQVLTIIPVFVIWTTANLPVWFFMLIYMGEQVFMSIQHSQMNGGVAWWAHIGGFATGWLLIRLFPVSPGWKAVFSRPRHRPFP